MAGNWGPSSLHCPCFHFLSKRWSATAWHKLKRHRWLWMQKAPLVHSSFFISLSVSLSLQQQIQETGSLLSLNWFLCLPHSCCLETHHGQMLLEWQSLFSSVFLLSNSVCLSGQIFVRNSLLLELWTGPPPVLRRETRRAVLVFTLNSNNAVPKVRFCSETISSDSFSN